jgi:hypothetical protein
VGKLTRIREALNAEADKKFLEANVAEGTDSNKYKSDAENLRRIGQQWKDLYESSADADI